MKKKIGFIGAGLINQYCHIPAFKAQKNIEFNSLCDLDSKLLKNVFDKYSFKHQYIDIDDLLKKNDIDALVLTVARKDTLKVLEKIYSKRNIKILCEKPFGLSSSESNLLIKKYPIESSNTMVGYMKKYEPAFLDLKKIIYKNKYGKLLSCSVKNSMGSSYCNPFNYFKRSNFKKYINGLKSSHNKHYENYLNVFSHDYNLITNLLGKKVKIDSVFLNTAGEGRVNLNINNIPISFDTSYNDKKKWDEVFRFNFAKAEIELRLPPALLINELASLSIIDYKINNKIIKNYPPNWSFKIQAKMFSEFIQNKIKNPSTPSDAAFDVELIEKIWKQI